MQLQEGRAPAATPSRKNGPIWTESAKLAFENPKNAIGDNMTLRFLDPRKPGCIEIDASTSGVGSALFQPNYEGDVPDIWGIPMEDPDESLHMQETRFMMSKELLSQQPTTKAYEELIKEYHGQGIR